MKRQQNQLQSQEGQGGNQIQSQSQNQPGGQQFQTQSQGQSQEPIATPTVNQHQGNQQHVPQGNMQQGNVPHQYENTQPDQRNPQSNIHIPQGNQQPYQPINPYQVFGSPFVSPFGLGGFGPQGFPQQPGFGFGGITF